jgi:single-strand DNA-binding protein
MSGSNINISVISGNLTQDPELRHTGKGTPVCRLRVAVNSRRKVNGEWVDKPNYFNVIVWGKHGETCHQYLEKGRAVAVEGRLDWREYEAKGGGKREAVEIIADTVQFGPKKQDGGDGGAGGGEEKPRRTPVRRKWARGPRLRPTSRSRFRRCRRTTFPSSPRRIPTHRAPAERSAPLFCHLMTVGHRFSP